MKSLFALCLMAGAPTLVLANPVPAENNSWPCKSDSLLNALPNAERAIVFNACGKTPVDSDPTTSRYQKMAAQLQQKKWNEIDWNSFSRRDIDNLIRATEWAREKQYQPESIDLVMSAADDSLALLTPPNDAYIGFLLRNTPCVTGGVAEAYAESLAQAFNVAPNKILLALEKEQIQYEADKKGVTLQSSSSSAGCHHRLTQNKNYSVADTLEASLSFAWEQDAELRPKHLADTVATFKRAHKDHVAYQNLFRFFNPRGPSPQSSH